MNSTFKYFAFGSNLLESRLNFSVKSAKRVSIGKLKNYRLDFNYWSKRWQGNAATVVPHENLFVWGAIWEVPNCDMINLDRQEGVPDGVYEVISVEVEKPDGTLVHCRSYQLRSLPEYCTTLPPSRYPSKIYLHTIIEGALESELPPEYVDQLKLIPHNDFNGPVDLHCHD